MYPTANGYPTYGANPYANGHVAPAAYAAPAPAYAQNANAAASAAQPAPPGNYAAPATYTTPATPAPNVYGGVVYGGAVYAGAYPGVSGYPNARGPAYTPANVYGLPGAVPVAGGYASPYGYAPYAYGGVPMVATSQTAIGSANSAAGGGTSSGWRNRHATLAQ
jgi:hypothetical protein